MIENKEYCMSSFLMFRTIANKNFCFPGYANIKNRKPILRRVPITNSEELEYTLKEKISQAVKSQKTALALSGGIDSAILAKFMPKGSIAYTFKCVVPGLNVTDETFMAARYADECGLEHRIVKIYWEDFEMFAPILMNNKGAPIHSIEVQIYKAALQAKTDGVEAIIFGEAADACYGGLSDLLSKTWTIGDFIERYSFLMPYKVLKDPLIILEPYHDFVKDGLIDPHKFVSKFFMHESISSYVNALEAANINGVLPFSETYLAEPIDYARIRSGENKYLVREIFQKLYPNFTAPPKTPMPRPMNEWFNDWDGPKRSEFWPHCIDSMTGDQKWLVWVLEQFLNMLD